MSETSEKPPGNGNGPNSSPAVIAMILLFVLVLVGLVAWVATIGGAATVGALATVIASVATLIAAFGIGPK